MNTAVEKSAFWLNEIARQQHRGRGDTWSAARDRAAKLAGIERSYAKRIWDRWQTMNDVSGEAVLRLQDAYDAICQKHERVAGAYRAERLQIEAQHAAHQSPNQAVD